MKRVAGFTLVELIIAMILIAILAASLLPRAPSQESLTIKGRAEQLASDIRYAQTLSMTTGARHCLELTPASGTPYNGYRLRRTVVAACDTAAEHPAGLVQPVSICSGTDCASTSALPNDYVQFDGRGIPYSAPATALVADAVITLSDGGGSKTVTISPTTGRVIVQ